jgi:hypothetical protein
MSELSGRTDAQCRPKPAYLSIGKPPYAVAARMFEYTVNVRGSRYGWKR